MITKYFLKIVRICGEKCKVLQKLLLIHRINWILQFFVSNCFFAFDFCKNDIEIFEKQQIMLQ